MRRVKKFREGARQEHIADADPGFLLGGGAPLRND